MLIDPLFCSSVSLFAPILKFMVCLVHISRIANLDALSLPICYKKQVSHQGSDLASCVSRNLGGPIVDVYVYLVHRIGR